MPPLPARRTVRGPAPAGGAAAGASPPRSKPPSCRPAPAPPGSIWSGSPAAPRHHRCRRGPVPGGGQPSVQALPRRPSCAGALGRMPLAGAPAATWEEAVIAGGRPAAAPEPGRAGPGARPFGRDTRSQLAAGGPGVPSDEGLPLESRGPAATVVSVPAPAPARPLSPFTGQLTNEDSTKWPTEGTTLPAGPRARVSRRPAQERRVFGTDPRGAGTPGAPPWAARWRAPTTRSVRGSGSCRRARSAPARGRDRGRSCTFPAGSAFGSAPPTARRRSSRGARAATW